MKTWRELITRFIMRRSGVHAQGKEVMLHLQSRLSRFSLFAAWLGVIVLFALLNPRFLTLRNFIGILRDGSWSGIIAVGMTMLIICAEIDLSVGSMAALASVLVAYLALEAGLSLPVAVIITLLAGSITGFFIGGFRVVFGIPSFITTIALYGSLRGVAYLISGGFPISPLPTSFGYIASGSVLGIPIPVFIFFAVFLIGHGILSKTTFGRYVYAVGGNEEVARRAGINVGAIKTATFVIVSTLSAFAGILLASRLLSGIPNVATGWELTVVAEVIIGGTSLFGGEGNLWGTLVGILFMSTLNSGMVMMGVSPYMQMVVQGLVILLAISIGKGRIMKRAR